MSRQIFTYNQETCTYQTESNDLKRIKFMLFLIFALISGLILTGLYIQRFQSPHIFLLKLENQNLQAETHFTSKEINDILFNLDALKYRDNNIYRVIMEATTRNETNINDVLSSNKNCLSCLINDTRILLDAQDRSYTELEVLAGEKAKLLAATPAIQPISNKSLRRLSSGYGERKHPRTGKIHFHTGIDFSAPIGTPIYATADGIIQNTQTSNQGYGNQVLINHSFGFKTRYAHMHSILVTKGQRVKRGEQIGTVGNTGTSTGSHIHYEVIKGKKHINPVDYFFKDLNDQEYEEILHLASVKNQSLS